MADQIYIKEPDGTLVQTDHFPASLEAVPGSDESIPEYDNYVYTILKTTIRAGGGAETTVYRTYTEEEDAKNLVDTNTENKYNIKGLVSVDPTMEAMIVMSDQSNVIDIIYTYVKNELHGEVLEREQTWH